MAWLLPSYFTLCSVVSSCLVLSLGPFKSRKWIETYMQVVTWEAISGSRNEGPGKWKKKGGKLITGWIFEFTGHFGLDFTRTFWAIYRMPENDRETYVSLRLVIIRGGFPLGCRYSCSPKRPQDRKQKTPSQKPKDNNVYLRQDDISTQRSLIGAVCCS